MVWHRGLSIPRARNLNREEVQKGKEVFNRIGCASCHRASWKTKEERDAVVEFINSIYF